VRYYGKFFQAFSARACLECGKFSGLFRMWKIFFIPAFFFELIPMKLLHDPCEIVLMSLLVTLEVTHRK
jgi:hypothetical protein